MIISAIELLHKFLEFKLLAEVEEWEEETLKTNPPRYYRFKQLEALFKAYELGNLKDFGTGDFISDREDEDFEMVVDNIKEEITKEIEDTSTSTIEILFEELINYRLLVSRLMNFPNQTIASNSILSFPSIKAQQINEAIKEKVVAIDKCLALIISPSRKSFTLEELQNTYEYPNIDLDELDAEYL